MYNTFKKLAAGSILFAAALWAHAGPVITNGGFETGDFTGWTLAGDTGFSFVDPTLPHGGDYSAWFGEPVSPSTISQSLATESGHSYIVKFWLSNRGGAIGNNTTVNEFQALVDGKGYVAVNDKAKTDYTEYALQFTATSGSTDLTFSFLHDDTFWFFDDVSITEVPADTQVPEPGTLLLFSIALGLYGLTRKRS